MGTQYCENDSLIDLEIAFAMQLGMTVDERQSDEFKRTVLKAGEYSLNQLMAKFDSAFPVHCRRLDSADAIFSRYFQA